ncbi:MAG TPA: DUF3305 domain-containing protein [Xanthobacteraceae bacterium]
MSQSPPLQRLSIGVVVERRKARSPWADFVWRPLAALPDAPDIKPWTVLRQDEERVTFYAGAAEVTLHAASAGFYRANLASGSPSLWIVLRPSVEPPFELVAVTADPSEGEAFTGAGNDLVEAVAMPTPVREAIESFLAGREGEQPFFKRARERADPQTLARQPAKGDKR